MNDQKKYAIATGICLLVAGFTLPTVIGPIVFGILAIGFAVKWSKERNDGETPWWAKSYLTRD